MGRRYLHSLTSWNNITLPPCGETLIPGIPGWGQKLGRRVGPIWVNENVPLGIYTIRVNTRGSVEATAETSITIEGNYGDYTLILINDWFKSIERYLSSVSWFSLTSLV